MDTTLIGIILGAVFIFLTWVSRLYKKHYQYYDNLPGPPYHPIIGNLKQINAANATQTLNDLTESWARKYGKIYRLVLPGRAIVSIADGATIHHIMTQDDVFVRTQAWIDAFGTVAPGSLIVTEGQIWKSRRKLLVGAFSPAQLRYATEVIEQVTNSLIQKWEKLRKDPKTQDIQIHRELMNATVDVIGLVAFGHNFESVTNESKVEQEVHDLTAYVEARITVPKFLWKFAAKGVANVDETVNKLKAIPIDILRQRRSKDSIAAGNEQEGGKRQDLLARILELHGTDGNDVMSDEQIINEILLFFIAGHETTSNSLCWILYLLSQHQGVVDKLRKEIEEVIGNEELNYDMHSKLKYTEAVIKETLRVIPTVPMTGRQCVQETEILGHKIRPGTLLTMNFQAAHHDPEMFENPMEFIPERWFAPDINQKFFFPFGDGPKICVGQKLAMLELKFIIAKLIKVYDFKLVEGQNITRVHSVTVGPKNGLFMNISPRQSL